MFSKQFILNFEIALLQFNAPFAKTVIRIPNCVVVYFFIHSFAPHYLLFFSQEPRLNVETLSKRDVLLLFSVLEGELEARDFVIQALKVCPVSSLLTIVFLQFLCKQPSMVAWAYCATFGY